MATLADSFLQDFALLALAAALLALGLALALPALALAGSRGP